MFLKPIRIKSHSECKTTERKKIIEDFRTKYDLNYEQCELIFGRKNAQKMKICTADGTHVLVYKFDCEPLLLQLDATLLPTVCLLWLVPELLPVFTTHEAVVAKLMNGADLMLPGLVTDKPITPNSFNRIQKGTFCSINTQENFAAVAVGYTNLSSEDIFMSAGRGKVVNVLHVLGDEICALGRSVSRPALSKPVPDCPEADLAESMERLAANAECERNENMLEMMTLGAEKGAYSETDVGVNMQGEIQRDPDEVIKACFLNSVKSVPNAQLPMPVNVFYANFVLKNYSPGQSVDIRKTTYGKVSIFLKAMETEGFLTLNEPKQGILMIEKVNRDHPSLSGVTLGATAKPTPSKPDWPPDYGGPPVIEDVRLVSGPAIELYKRFGYSPNSCVTQAEARQVVDSYVRQQNLQDANRPDLVRVDSVLMKFCDPMLYKEANHSTLSNPVHLISFRDVISGTLKGLKLAYRLTFPDTGETHLWRGKGVPAVSIYMVTKNQKKLTRIANLPVFRIDPDIFAQRLQVFLACSSGRVEDPQKPGVVVVQAQGDHISSVSKLLAETYRIPKRCIEGYTEKKKKR